MWPFRRRDADFSEEIEAHIALEIEQLVGEGMSLEEARSAAHRRFGNVTSARERFYESHRVMGLDQLRQDLRAAVRTMLRERGVVVVALLSLAIGIGATTAIVSLVDAVLLRPLPYRDADRIVTVWEEMTSRGFPRNTPAPANYIDWRERSRVFEGLAATLPTRANLTGDGAPERVLGRRVTANFFDVLGASPAIGRTFTEDEDRQAVPVVIISYTLWQRRYRGDVTVIGRKMTMNDAPATVIGVMPASFVFRDREIEYWAPISFTPAQRALRTAHVLNVVGRLRPGVTLDAARADMSGIADALSRVYPMNANVGVTLVPIREEVYGDTRQQLIVLSLAAGCLLLLMSANVANLLMARAAAKRRELATRAALGAGRLRLVAQMASEGIVWAVTGGLLGIAIAVAGLDVLNALIPVSLAEGVAPQLNGRLLLMALGVSLLTGVAFSIVPALRASSVSLVEVLKETGGGLGGAWRARSALITLQIAVSVALLVGAGLMVQSLANLRSVGLGFRPEGLVTFNIALPGARYDETRRAMFYEEVLDQLRTVPGVLSAGFGSTLPFLSRGNTAGYRIEGRTAGPFEPTDVRFRIMTTDYLRTLGAVLIAGRLPDARDGANAPPVAVINRSLAALNWPNGDALGHRVAAGPAGAPWMTIVGIVEDVRENGYEVPLMPGLYVLAAQVGLGADNLVVRVAGEATAIVPAVRQIVARIDPEQPVAAVRTMQDIVDLEVVDRRQQSIVLAAFAVTAVLLAALGIYGLVSYSVTLRRREVGLRTALGASIGEVTRALLARGLVLVAAGVSIGVLLSLVGSRVMEGLLFGIKPQDPLTFTATTAIVGAISVLACWLPAWRAARMQPMSALRQE